MKLMMLKLPPLYFFSWTFVLVQLSSLLNSLAEIDAEGLPGSVGAREDRSEELYVAPQASLYNVLSERKHHSSEENHEARVE